MRDLYSTKWIDYDVSLSASLLGSGFAGTDYDNQGKTPAPGTATSVGDFFDLNFGGNVQFGYFGATAMGDIQQYSLTSQSGTASPSLSLDVGRFRVQAAYGFFNGQLVAGAGLRIIALQINEKGGGTLFTMTGAAPEAGALWMPSGYPWRVGATVRGTVTGTSLGAGNVTVDPDGTRHAGSFVLPYQVTLPWEAELGVAYQVGPRPLNPAWLNPHSEEAHVRTTIEEDRARREAEYQAALARLPPAERPALMAVQARQETAARELEDQWLDTEVHRLQAVRRARYANWPREKILLLASVLFTGTSDSAVSVSGFLQQKRELVGQSLSVTPRLGIEGEPIHERLTARVGTYLEPSRYADGFPRQHFTFGGDLKLFPLTFWGLLSDAPWKLGIYLDLAPRFNNAGLGIGVWH